jgi:PAS domain S-box-containing protein
MNSTLPLVDVLRQQVARLSRELVERDSVLHERTRHLRVAQALAHLGSWEWEVESGTVRCSSELYRIFGRESGADLLTFDGFLAAVVPDDRDRVIASINHALGGRALHDVEYRVVRPNGEVRTIHSCAEVLRDDNGKPCRMSGSVLDITDRKSMEQAVRESEDRYRTLVDLSPSGVFVFCEGRTVYANHTGAVLMGVADPSELLDRSMFDFLHPDYHHDVRENVHRVLAGNVSVHSAERIYLRKDGTPVPVQMEAARIVWNGTPAMIALVSDVTERKQAEEALRASEERFAKAFKASPHPIFISELETGRLVEVNDAASELLGDCLGPIEGQIVWEIEVWGTTEEQTRFRERLKQVGSVRNLEVNIRAGNGDVRHFLLSSEVIELNGRLCRVTVGDDITDRQRAEEELRRSHALLRQVIDGSPNLVFAKDREGRFTMANRAVADCYGTTVDDLIGQMEADFNPHWDEVEFSREKDLRVMTSLQECFIAEEKFTDWSGRMRWFQTIKRPIVDEHGRFQMVLGAATDITERKRMEERLLQHERDLNAALQDREQISQDLHDDILQSVYAAGLGLEACKSMMRQQHELANDHLMTTLEQTIGQLNHVIQKIRNFISGLDSRVKQGGDHLIDLRTMIQMMCATSSIQCRVTIDDEVGQYLSTESALHLINIVREALSNALRHSQATRITVSVRPLVGSVRLTVTDNGIGFNPKVVQGVGHGLENMAARAHKTGGVFAVRSEPQRGTRILLDLPKDQQDYFN